MTPFCFEHVFRAGSALELMSAYFDEDHQAEQDRVLEITEISTTYRLETLGPRAIRRRYAGTVSVNIALIGGRIERGIVAELAQSLPLAAGSTQAWLDRIPPSMAARA